MRWIEYISMGQENISVREIEERDFENIVDYFLQADKDFLTAMGADASKLPERNKWLQILADEFSKPVEGKQFYYVIWLFNDKPIGHSNINKIIFGEEAYVHLHTWNTANRKKGIGIDLFKMSLPYFFEKFKLKNLYCEPYALNPAPNKVLQHCGFDFIKRYHTTPGWINFYQEVNRWVMSFEKYKELFGKND